jgi:Flp pilus assembly protein TadD
LRNLQAALHIESGDLDQAERAIRAAMKLEPDNASLHNNLGYISMKKGKLEDAEARFRRAVDLDGTYPEFRLNLGMMLALSKKYREAERELSKALALDPESPEGRSLLRDAAMRLAISLHDRGDYKGALFEFRKLTSLFPEDEEVWNNMGLLLHRMGRFGEAEKVFRKAIAIGGPKSAEVRYSAAWTFLRAGKKQDAAHSFSETIRLSPGGWRSETAKAALLVLEGRHKESLERISNALNLNQNNPYAYYLAGLSLRALGRREEAVIAFEKALQADAGHRDSKDELKRQP